VIPPPPCDPAPSGLVGWWKGEGNAGDTTGLNNGAAQGNLSYATGEVGQSLKLDGSTADIFCSSSPSLNVGTGGGLTIECWINPTSVSAACSLVEWNSGSPTGFGTHFVLSSGPPNSPSQPGTLYANLVDTAGNYHYFLTAQNLIGVNSFQHV